ncbi:MAG: tetratricopeptide repeat protein [Cyanobacteria bacterium REEB494]|nr:tetratricopeptide repeat protein [Cyanobacteria bacterium REEB494]
MTPELEASLKVAIRSLIYKSQVNPDVVATIVSELNKEELTNQDWEILLNKEGADIAIEKQIYSPHLIRLLTLRALLIPETLPEFLKWLKISKSKKLDTKQIVFLEFQKGISPLFPKIQASKGITYLLTKLVSNNLSVDEVSWLLLNSEYQTIWGDAKKEVINDIKEDLKLFEDYYTGFSKEDLDKNKLKIKTGIWKNLIKKWEDITNTYQYQGYKALAVFMEKLEEYKTAVYFYQISEGIVESKVFNKVSNLSIRKELIIFGILIEKKETVFDIITQNIKNTIENLIPNKYENLKKLLKDQKFKEADQETTRVMLALANRENEGYLRVEDGESFPFQELCIIDNLWLKYSQGKFGFSVQQEIYKNLGGTKEINPDIWKSFEERVGWIQTIKIKKRQDPKVKRLGYDELNFSLQASAGHLPFFVFLQKIKEPVSYGYLLSLFFVFLGWVGNSGMFFILGGVLFIYEIYLDDSRDKEWKRGSDRESTLETGRVFSSLLYNNIPHKNRGLARYHLGDKRGAIDDYNQAIELDSDDADAYYNRGLVRKELGDKRGAISDYTQAILLNPNYADGYYNRGLVYKELGDNQNAIYDYTQAISLDPNYAQAYNNRGNARSELGDKRGAISDYTQAISLNPNDGSLYYNRGLAYKELGDNQSAIDDYDKAISLNPNDGSLYYNRGLAYKELGDKQGAIVDYNQAIQINPNYAHVYYKRGNARYELGDKQGAIVDYNQAIQINPNYAEAYGNRGNARSYLGDKQGAIVDYNQVIQINPNDALAYNNRGLARYELGDKQGAIVDYNQAIQINPNYAIAYYNRGNARSYLGDKQDAIGDFQTAARLYQQQGNSQWYQYSLNRISQLR